MSFIDNSQSSPPSMGMASKNVLRWPTVPSPSHTGAGAESGLCHNAKVSVRDTECTCVEEEE